MSKVNNFNVLQNEYRKKGFIKIKNFFKKKDILLVKKNISDNKKKYFLYYERIKKKKILRRIENISNYNKDAKNIIYGKNIKKLLKKLTIGIIELEKVGKSIRMTL